METEELLKKYLYKWEPAIPGNMPEDISREFLKISPRADLKGHQFVYNRFVVKRELHDQYCFARRVINSNPDERYWLVDDQTRYYDTSDFEIKWWMLLPDDPDDTDY